MKKGERNLIRDIFSIYVPTFFIVTGLSIVSPILPIYAESFGVSYALAALAISIYAVAVCCSIFLSGCSVIDLAGDHFFLEL